jgi:hypothetical protein
MTCPTCGGPAAEVWPDGHHPFAAGPEASVCGRCGAPRNEPRHQPTYRFDPDAPDEPSPPDERRRPRHREHDIA